MAKVMVRVRVSENACWISDLWSSDYWTFELYTQPSDTCKPSNFGL